MVVRDEECGAIGRSTLQRVRGDPPTRARSILNDNRGAKLILQLLGERARDASVPPPGGKPTRMRTVLPDWANAAPLIAARNTPAKIRRTMRMKTAVCIRP